MDEYVSLCERLHQKSEPLTTPELVMNLARSASAEACVVAVLTTKAPTKVAVRKVVAAQQKVMAKHGGLALFHPALAARCQSALAFD